mmetsp:Transcript_26120/g.62055  ORF Transcript_26120/g.62055 Transcript_26120/m.62055 type:complete len:617 (+) Transcript_26120:323-2173(+)
MSSSSSSSSSAARHQAMVDFLGTFPTLSGPPPQSLEELSDGVVLFEVLSEIAPDHFDTTTIARHLGDNWALKSSNLRKLVRNLEYYYHEDLKKDAPETFEKVSASINKIARSGDVESLEPLVELVAAAAVTCPDKGEFVGRIMSLNQESQIEMKSIIESSLQLIEDYDNQANFDDEDLLENDQFDDDVYGGGSGGAAADGSGSAAAAGTDSTNGVSGMNDANQAASALSDADKEGLEQALVEARREVATQKSQLIEVREDAEKAQSKLRSIVEDLQDRLAKRQDELITSEEELRDATTELDALKARVGELEEDRAQLADELDVASAKAQQLHKAEATVMAYKKRLDSVGVMNQQMTDLEDQAAGYLRQIMDLESEVKKTTALTKQVDSLQEQLSALEKVKSENSDFIKNSTAEIAELKTQLTSANKAKKAYEDELKELREQQAVTHEDVVVEGFDSQAPVSAEQREKMMRLEIENKKLTEELEAFKASGGDASAAAAAAATAAAAAASQEEAKTLKSEIEDLKAELEKKTAENKKIGSDKEKLEAYTKRTLAKFQDKYLVALQECKAKLKEKQDKIEVLEGRSATEKTAQKREERLLSSTIYELGLAIMQNRLKER